MHLLEMIQMHTELLRALVRIDLKERLSPKRTGRPKQIGHLILPWSLQNRLSAQRMQPPTGHVGTQMQIRLILHDQLGRLGGLPRRYNMKSAIRLGQRAVEGFFSSASTRSRLT